MKVIKKERNKKLHIKQINEQLRNGKRKKGWGRKTEKEKNEGKKERMKQRKKQRKKEAIKQTCN